MNRIALFIVLLLCMCVIHVHGQKKKEKPEKPPVFNYVIDDPMDKFQPANQSQLLTYNYLVPEFYFHRPKKHYDTTFEFFCYDVHDSLIKAVFDFDSVYYYSLYKSYTDSAHTYIDKDGKRQYLPVSSIVKRYDKVGREKWMTIEYPGNKYGELRAFKHVIVATDTVVTNTLQDHYQQVFHYYKLIK